MSRHPRTQDNRNGRCRPLVERLESRLALSNAPTGPVPPMFSRAPVSAYEGVESPPAPGPDLTAVATDPAPGASLRGAPATISVRFDRPLDEISLLSDDVLIQKLQSDGSWALAHDGLNAPLETLDATGSVLILTPQIPLTAGRYRLVLPEFSTLTGADGSVVADLGSDQVLGEFTIERPGVTLADATPLGVAGPIPWLVSGSLDLASDPNAVRLYRFEVPAGHHWRFGAEVSAQREGSGLLSSLTLFDASGRPIATSTKGRRDAPADPYLFTGLGAGTYYLGISGAGNVPGLGGYDPSTGDPGTIVFGQAGGTFRLTLVADPADAPTQLLGFTLNFADPRSHSPTGFSMSFSGL
ncbi:MAG: hypothetical protein U0835_18705, partial [Isosphaeraceae bacterium]